MFDKIARKLRKLFPNAYQVLLNIKQGRYNYTFSKEKYPNSFLANSYPSNYSGEKAPEVIYCFWTGDNPLTENRKKGLEALEKNTGIPVKLITPKNLPEYIKPDFPLHKGYELLSLTMRSDYLRCYFMHHYGGGYADIKPFNHSWKPSFEKLNKDKDTYVIGYPEIIDGGVAPVEHMFLPDKSIYENYSLMKEVGDKIYKDLRKHNPLLIGNGSFICKPYTPITTEWYEEVNKRMDDAYDSLEEFNRNNKNDSFIYYDMTYPTKGKGYPIPYFYLMQIFHPIVLKYHKHTLRDKKLLPILKDYR